MTLLRSTFIRLARLLYVQCWDIPLTTFAFDYTLKAICDTVNEVVISLAVTWNHVDIYKFCLQIAGYYLCVYVAEVQTRVFNAFVTVGVAQLCV